VANVVRPFDLGRMVWRTIGAVAGVRKVRQTSSGKAALPLSAPRTSINVAVHARRRVAFAAASLADAKKLKNAMGTTVNDVVLAMCTGALRTYLLAGDELPDIPLVSVVPVSVTPDVAELKGSNKVSAMFVQLPCHMEDPWSGCRPFTKAPRGPRRSTRRSAPPRCRTGPSTPPRTSSPWPPASTPG
jgi:diacylglycerol O-acyltransferase